jgi:hypothetical protein
LDLNIDLAAHVDGAVANVWRRTTRKSKATLGRREEFSPRFLALRIMSVSGINP